MALRKSPGGSIFPYYYKNGVLFGAHFGSFFDDEEGLLARMKAEGAFFEDTPGQLPYWADFYETRLTDRILLEFSRMMERLQSHITRLAIVGFSRRDKKRLDRLMKDNGIGLPMPVRFFNDPEEAKSWLVGES